MTEEKGGVKYVYRPDAHFPDVTRITVVSEAGREFEKYNLFEGGVDLFLQDDGRTLKIFPKLKVEGFDD